MSDKETQDSRERGLQLEHFFTRHLGEGWKSEPIIFLDGMQTIAALWPMNDVFRPHHAQINSVSYSAEYEREADESLALLAQGGGWSANHPSPGAWRVLQERHIQAITVAAANAAAGNARLLPLPQALPAQHRTMAAMLFLQWAMVLPWPPAAESKLP